MAGVLQHLRSSTLDKRPNPASMVDGQIAINYASGAPGMFFKDSNGSLVKVGPVHVGSGAPNAVPASGGTAGNSIGEQWLDTSGGTYVFKIWDGAAWRSEAGEFVNATGDTMTGDLVMNNANLVFEGSVDDGFETTLTVVNPTADRTITLPNVTGTVVTTGDSGTVTSTMIADGTIVNADVNASAAIAGTKISPNFGSQNVVTTGTSTAASFIPTSSSVPTNGVYLPSANNVAISSNGVGRLFIDASGRVGVSNSSPSYVFDVTGQARIAGDFHVSGGSVIDGISQDLFLQGNTGYGIIFRTNGSTERMRLDSSGRLGLGTSSPQNRLHVSDGEFTISTGGNVADSGGIINFGITPFPSYSPMATVQGLLANATGTELQGGLGFFTRPNGVAGQSLQRRMTITNGGNVGIGTASPGATLDVNGKLRLSSTEDNQLEWVSGAQTWRSNVVSGGKWYLYDVTNAKFPLDVSANTTCKLDINTSHVAFTTNNSERARIDSSGRLLVGTSSAYAIQGFSRSHYFAPIANENNNQMVVAGINTGTPALFFTRTRGGTPTTYTVVQDGDSLGLLEFFGADGTSYGSSGARIQASVDGTPGANDMPGRLVFSTTADGASSPTERLRITNAGVLQVADAGNISVGTTTGTKIGTATTQKLGFYNATPVVQPTAVADATDAASVITQLNALLSRMRTLGLIAT